MALFDYEAGSTDELSFSEGDIITDVVQSDTGWLRGTANGETGIFPANCVEERQSPNANGKTPKPLFSRRTIISYYTVLLWF